MQKIGLWLPDPIIPFKSDPAYCVFTYFQKMQALGCEYYGLVGYDKQRKESYDALDSGKLNWIHRILGTKKHQGEKLDVIYMFQTGWMYPEHTREIDGFMQILLQEKIADHIIFIDTDNDLQAFPDLSRSLRAEYATYHFIEKYLRQLMDFGYQVTFKASYTETPPELNIDYVPYTVSDYFPQSKVRRVSDCQHATMFVGGIWLRSEEARQSILETIPNTLSAASIMKVDNDSRNYESYLIDKSWKQIVKDDHRARVGRTQFFDWTGNYFDKLSDSLVLLDATRKTTTVPVIRTNEFYWAAAPVITRQSIFPGVEFKYNFAYNTQADLNSEELKNWLPNVLNDEFRRLAVEEYRDVVARTLDVSLHLDKFTSIKPNGEEVYAYYHRPERPKV